MPSENDIGSCSQQQYKRRTSEISHKTIMGFMLLMLRQRQYHEEEQEQQRSSSDFIRFIISGLVLFYLLMHHPQRPVGLRLLLPCANT